MDCDDATLLVAAAEARTLSNSEDDSLHRHADDCPECRALLAQRKEGRFRWVVQVPEDAFDDLDLLVLPEVDPSVFAAGDELARGGMGRVIRARDRRLGREVAIKEVIGPGMRARFEREVMITAQLQHPAIIPVYEAGAWPNGSAFYTMRLVSGGTLGDAIAKTTTLEQRIALLPHVVALTDALAYAHSKRIVHRDLKPGNVLVGEFGETVVIDWGLAKDLGKQADDGTSLPPLAGGDAGGLTIAGSVMGTPGFMSPEQAAGGEVDERTDVFALGAILYNLLAGHPPYLDGDVRSAQALIELARERPPTPIGELAPRAPRDLCVIVERAMARQRDARYRTAKEMAGELHRFSAGQLLRSRDYSTRELIARWVARHRGAVIVAAVATVAVAAAGLASVHEVVARRDVAETALAFDRLERGRQLLVAGEPAQAAPLLADALRALPGDPLARRLATRAVRDADRRIAAFPDSAAAAFSPDGRELAIGRDDGAIELADAATGRVERTLPAAGGAGPITELRYLAGGHALVAVSRGGASVRELAGGGDVALAHEQVNDALVVGDLIVLATDHEVRVVHRDGTVVAHDALDKAGALDATPDGGELLAIGSTTARVWHLPGLAPLAQLPGAYWGRIDGAGGIVLGDDLGLRRYLLADPAHAVTLMTGQAQPIARLAGGELATANLLVDLEHGATHPYTTLAYPNTVAALDRTHFVTGGFDHTIRIWDRDRLARPLAVLDAADATADFAVDAAAKRVASIPWHGTVELWSTAELRAPVLLTNLGGNEVRRILAGGPRLVVGLHPDSRAEILDEADAPVATLRGWLMGERRGAIVMDEAGKLYRYDARDGHLLGPPIADSGAIGAAELSPSGRILATAAHGVVTLRDAQTGATFRSFNTGAADITQVVVDDDGHAATGHDDGMMRFWNARTGALVAARWGHAGHVDRLTLRGDRVFSESWDQSVRAWQLATGAPLGVVLSNVRGAVAISGDGRLLATGEPEGEVDVWDAASGRLLDRVPTSQVMTALAFVDDDHVVAGGRGGALELLDLSDHPRTDAEIARLARGHTR